MWVGHKAAGWSGLCIPGREDELLYILLFELITPYIRKFLSFHLPSFFHPHSVSQITELESPARFLFSFFLVEFSFSASSFGDFAKSCGFNLSNREKRKRGEERGGVVEENERQRNTRVSGWNWSRWEGEVGRKQGCGWCNEPEMVEGGGGGWERKVTEVWSRRREIENIRFREKEVWVKWWKDEQSGRGREGSWWWVGNEWKTWSQLIVPSFHGNARPFPPTLFHSHLFLSRHYFHTSFFFGGGLCLRSFYGPSSVWFLISLFPPLSSLVSSLAGKPTEGDEGGGDKEIISSTMRTPSMNWLFIN